jgi:hypothetical protein
MKELMRDSECEPAVLASIQANVTLPMKTPGKFSIAVLQHLNEGMYGVHIDNRVCKHIC